MSAIYEIPIGQVDPVTINWADWLATLPTGQTLDSATYAFDGGAGGMTIPTSVLAGTLTTVYIDATAGVVGFYYLKVVPTSDTPGLPIPDMKGPRWLAVRVVEKVFVEDAT